MRERSGKRSISGLAAALLLCVFALMILSVLLSGAGAYQRLTVRGEENYDSRSSAQYVATKLRQAPSAESVELRTFGGSDCLCITEEIDGAEYITRVYCHEGWIRELFTLAEGDFAPEDGEKILEAEALELSLENELIRVAVTNGSRTEFFVSLRGEATP
ncbi:MAG: DUF4860 domain-containing protein [Oscillospiraceae bacterium]|nr:DUF4860 domain-containing protein [Oscillospiraceae bacterium]